MIKLARGFAIPSADRYWWTGPGEVEIDGRTWTPAQIEVGDIQLSGETPAPVTVTLPPSVDQRTYWLRGPGYLAAFAQLFFRTPGGAWEPGAKVVGLLGPPAVEDDGIEVQVDPAQLPAAPTPQVWSDDAQQERSPGDLGYSQVAAGGGLDEQWP